MARTGLQEAPVRGREYNCDRSSPSSGLSKTMNLWKNLNTHTHTRIAGFRRHNKLLNYQPNDTRIQT